MRKRPPQRWLQPNLIENDSNRGVFLDETAVKTNLTRLHGWVPQGERLTMDAPFGRWGTQTL